MRHGKHSIWSVISPTGNLPAARYAVFAAMDEVGLTRPQTVAEWQQTATFLASIAETLESCGPDLYELDHAALRTALAPARGSVWARMSAKLFSGGYRAGRATVEAAYRSTDGLSARAALDLVEHAGAHVTEWRERAGSGEPRLPDGLEGLTERAGALVHDLDAFHTIAGVGGLDRMPHEDLASTLARLASDPVVVANLPRIRAIEARFREAGVAPVMEQVGNDIPPELAARAVEHAWLRRVLDDLEFDDRRLSAFDSDGHSRRRDEFAQSDRRHLGSNPQRVHRLTAEAIIETMNGYPEETALIRREAAKKSRHLSVRQLFARAPHVLSALRPCWTMSPVLAAEMIPANRQLFDVVIFDEASQIPPAEAIGSLARAPPSRDRRR